MRSRLDDLSGEYVTAEQRLFDSYGLHYESRSLPLTDPAIEIGDAPFLDDPERCADLILELT